MGIIAIPPNKVCQFLNRLYFHDLHLNCILHLLFLFLSISPLSPFNIYHCNAGIKEHLGDTIYSMQLFYIPRCSIWDIAGIFILYTQNAERIGQISQPHPPIASPELYGHDFGAR